MFNPHSRVLLLTKKLSASDLFNPEKMRDYVKTSNSAK